MAPESSDWLLQAVRATVARSHLLESGDHVLVAVSGGPDSVALLHALTRLRAERRLALTVCHVHHGLRAEADADAAFVCALAEQLGCPATVERVVVPLGAGRSPEEAARVARHAALGRVAREVGAQRIALGHTADDQAETVLMRFLQGAGPRGLAGMPVRRGRLVRPLLEVDRAAVLAHLHAHGLGWVDDSSNRDLRYLRNRIRHELLPLLAERAGARLPEALRRVAGASRELVDALDALLAPRLRELIHPGPAGTLLDLDVLRGLPPGATKALLRLALTEVAPPGPISAGLRATHLASLHRLLAARPGARVRLPRGIVVERARTGLWVSGGPEVVGSPVPVPGETRLAGWPGRLVADVVEPGRSGPASPAAALPDPRTEVWFDADALPGPLSIRPCGRPATMVPFGGTEAVRLSRLLATAGTARLARPTWPVLVACGPGGEEVLWLVGVRRGAAAPVGPTTRAVVRIRAGGATPGQPPGFPGGGDV
jgi:tRNA(Ile)-lysidine synthase